MRFTGRLKGRLIDCHTILFESVEDLDKNGGSNCEY